MNLSRRSLLVIMPVVLLSFLVASLIVFEPTQRFVERQEQNRLNYAVSELGAVFNQYTTFTESYLLAVTESHAFHEYLKASDEAYSELALVRSVEDSLRTFRQHRSDYLSVTIASNYRAPEISYYFELSDNPFSNITELLADFALSMFEGRELASWDYLEPENHRNTIVKAQLVDRYTFSDPLLSQLDNTVVVQLAIEPTEFNQLRDELSAEMNAQINVVSELSTSDGITAFATLGEDRYLVASLPGNHLQVQMRPLAGWLALVSLLFAVTASICLHGLMRRYVTRPVSLLEQDLADILAKRRTTIPNRSTGDDEIGRLARTFRTLYEDLSNSYSETRRILQQDNLTGLYNLGYVTEMASGALQEAQNANEQVALLYLDLDNFKFVNDKYGHRFGDELLQAFAKQLRSVISAHALAVEGDQPALFLPGRIGSDQFCLFVRHPLAFIITREIATGMQNLLADGLPFADARFPITASIGIAVYPEDGDSVSQLFSNADTAMHQAKLLGKNQVAHYSPALASKLRRRLELETALKSVSPDEEFKLVYMPLLNVRTDVLDGFEVLLRWDSPHFGNVEPDEFVPIAEACGVFAKIDEWVISTGLSSYPAIRELLGRDFKMSLNISSAQLRLSNLTEVLDRYAKRFGIAPHCIQLEITETVNIEFTAHASDFLNRLSSAGYILALDDFGAGFTSLLRLVEYPIDMVKFDKNFIQQTLKRGNRQILKPLVELCHSNGMLVTMEGAETQEDIDLLRTFDCDYIQGYFLGRPISLPDMEEAVRALRQGAQLTP